MDAPAQRLFAIPEPVLARTIQVLRAYAAAPSGMTVGDVTDLLVNLSQAQLVKVQQQAASGPEPVPGPGLMDKGGTDAPGN